MGDFSFNSFMNKLSELDTSRSNVNRILYPSTRYYTTKGNNNAAKQATPTQEATVAESPNVQGQTGTGTDVAAAGTTFGIAGRTEVSAGANKKNQNKHEPCANNTDFKLNFSGDSLLNGIIMAEVLGKPKYLRKGR